MEDYYLDPVAFDEQYNSYNNKGYALDPSSRYYIEDKTRISSNIDKKEKRKRKEFGDAADVYGEWNGPWAAFEHEATYKKTLQDATDSVSVMTFIKKRNLIYFVKVEKSPPPVPAQNPDIETEEGETKKPRTEEERFQAKSIFHGTELRDYLGRTFVDPPSHLKNIEHECWLPKKVIHTW